MRYIAKKDIETITHYLAMIMEGIGISVIVPGIIAIIYNEWNIFIYCLISGIISYVIGNILKKKTKKGYVKLKHGMIISAWAWIWAALVGAMIMYLSVDISFLDAFFENMSAWTGGGFTIFLNVEILPKSILFLRSFEQWIGGIGIIALITGILLNSGTPVARLYNAEARHEKISPSVGNTLKKIIKGYLIFTIIGILLFIIAGMPIFDSINFTFSSIATGGMSITNANFGYYNNPVFNIISIFLMIMGATSFLTVYKSIKTKSLDILKDTQFRLMIALIIIMSILILIYTNLSPMDAVFYTVSAITTTGFTLNTANVVAQWSGFMKFIIIVLMFIGGAAGSTSGGFKLIRFIFLLKNIHKTVLGILSPQGRIIQTKLRKLAISGEELKEANAYLSLYIILIFVGWGIFLAHGFDPLNSLFDVVSAQGNVGISTGVISPTMPDSAKIMTIINMWAGRLEIIPILVLLSGIYAFFKKSSNSHKKYKNSVNLKNIHSENNNIKNNNIKNKYNKQNNVKENKNNFHENLKIINMKDD
jgi:trk system potassium uptake protein TrkH